MDLIADSALSRDPGVELPIRLGSICALNGSPSPANGTRRFGLDVPIEAWNEGLRGNLGWRGLTGFLVY
jgi:hypothetical protein